MPIKNKEVRPSLPRLSELHKKGKEYFPQIYFIMRSVFFQ
nr:MAG TPA: hypothetical protein [Caudoviricetes sp.]